MGLAWDAGLEWPRGPGGGNLSLRLFHRLVEAIEVVQLGLDLGRKPRLWQLQGLEPLEVWPSTYVSPGAF